MPEKFHSVAAEDLLELRRVQMQQHLPHQKCTCFPFGSFSEAMGGTVAELVVSESDFRVPQNFFSPRTVVLQLYAK